MWQPIETAARDNRLVDLWCEYYDENGELYAAERRTDCHFVVSEGSWYDGGVRLGCGTDIRITHWMPLPEPPEKG
jgi:uncharacterized protein DUF551